MLASRHGDESRVTAAAIAAEWGRPALGVACDVRDEAAVDRLVELTLTRFGGLQILVNSAGIIVRGPIEDTRRADFDECFAVNVVGTWLMCRAAARPMKRAGDGRVINLASALGLVGAPERSVYASPKEGAYDLSSLRRVVYGASTIAPERLARAVTAFGDVFVQVYGQSECPLPISALSRRAHQLNPDGTPPARLASAGRVTPALELRIVDPARRELPIGAVGEIAVRGDVVMRGY